jgi:hypothetical protein
LGIEVNNHVYEETLEDTYDFEINDKKIKITDTSGNVKIKYNKLG